MVPLDEMVPVNTTLLALPGRAGWETRSPQPPWGLCQMNTPSSWGSKPSGRPCTYAGQWASGSHVAPLPALAGAGLAAAVGVDAKAAAEGARVATTAVAEATKVRESMAHLLVQSGILRPRTHQECRALLL